MNLGIQILEQFFRNLGLEDDSIDRFRLANELSDVGGNGFPKELLQLNAPMVIRGLLNFATFQMNRDWIYPYWVHRQLDPKSHSYVPRGQNPLFLNTTHRNWSAIGTPHGIHEAIVDPRGLLTPLPHTWSIDFWVVTDDDTLFPSLTEKAEQDMEIALPLVRTHLVSAGGLHLESVHFVGETSRSGDIVFSRVLVANTLDSIVEGYLCIGVRPFDPEGVSPIRTVEFQTPRSLAVNGVPAIVLNTMPDWSATSSYHRGDLAFNMLTMRTAVFKQPIQHRSECDRGLAHAVAAFHFSLKPNADAAFDFSIKLGDRGSIRHTSPAQLWRRSFTDRLDRERERWNNETNIQSRFIFGNIAYQNIFDANRNTLLILHDGDLITPGPYLYHHFWYRDATPMARALDLLGYHTRSRCIIDAFSNNQTKEGFFKGPDGEWDSNGAVLWSVYQHHRLHPSHLWITRWYPRLEQGARWLIRKRLESSNGLLPRSISAEHLGTADQYYWDSFWGLAGIRCIAHLARELKKVRDVLLFDEEDQSFTREVLQSISIATNRIGERLIPATPDRAFDESAIGSVAGIYPLSLFASEDDAGKHTIIELVSRFVDERGFLHPFIHSGYNPYLTMQLAHALLWMHEVKQAWIVADTIFRQTNPPYSLPEAIHPITKGGVMGDGHHGWAAAELVMFLRDCLIREEDQALILFEGNDGRFTPFPELRSVPTSFGTISCSIHHELTSLRSIRFEARYHNNLHPDEIQIHLPFRIDRAFGALPDDVRAINATSMHTVIHCSPAISRVFFETKD